MDPEHESGLEYIEATVKLIKDAVSPDVWASVVEAVIEDNVLFADRFDIKPAIVSQVIKWSLECVDVKHERVFDKLEKHADLIAEKFVKLVLDESESKRADREIKRLTTLLDSIPRGPKMFLTGTMRQRVDECLETFEKGGAGDCAGATRLRKFKETFF